jgi:hypothetical protein
MSVLDKFDPKRYGLITGSKCAVLHPKKSAEVGQRTYAKQLANQMYFRFYDEQGSWQTEHGNNFEAEAYVYFHENFDKSAVHKPAFIVQDNFGGSADCLCDDYGVDFKCPTSLEKWLDYLHVGIDTDQYHQAQMYMMLYNREEWKICAFLTETEKMSNNGMTYPVPQNQRMIVVNVERDIEWAHKTYVNAEPVIVARDSFYQNLITQFGQPLIK